MTGVYGDWVQRVTLTEDVPNTQIGYLVRVPGGSRLLARGLLCNALESIYGVRDVHEQREMEVIVLKHPGPESPHRAEGTPGLNVSALYTGTYFRAEGAKIADLASWLSFWTGKPLVDETRLEGIYDSEFPVKSWSPADLNAALANLGLSLESDRRKIEVVVVRKCEAQGQRHLPGALRVPTLL